MSKNPNKIIFFNIISTTLIVGINFFSAPLYSRMLGTENYGIVSIYSTWVTLAVTIFSLQAGSVMPVAQHEYPEKNQKEYQSSILLLILFSYALFSIFTVFAALIMGIDMILLFPGLLQGLGTYCVTYLNYKFTYEFNANKNLLLSIITSLMNLGFSLFFIFLMPKDVNYLGRVYGQALAYVLSGIFVIIYFIKRYPLNYKREYWIFTLPIAVPTIFHHVAYTVLNQCDRLMLQGMQGNHIVGIYALAAGFSAVITTIYTALNKSWSPFFYEHLKKNDIDQLKIQSKNYIELYTIITLGFMLLSREVFHIFASKQYWDGTSYVPIFAIGSYAVFLYSFSVDFEFYHKKTKKIALGTVLAALTNVILNYILISKIGSLGAVIATTIAHVFQFLFHYICAKTISGSVFPYKMMDFLPWFVIVVTVGIFCSVSEGMIIVRWMTGFLLGIYLLYKILKRKSIW